MEGTAFIVEGGKKPTVELKVGDTVMVENLGSLSSKIGIILKKDNYYSCSNVLFIDGDILEIHDSELRKIPNIPLKVGSKAVVFMVDKNWPNYTSSFAGMEGRLVTIREYGDGYGGQFRTDMFRDLWLSKTWLRSFPEPIPAATTTRPDIGKEKKVIKHFKNIVEVDHYTDDSGAVNITEVRNLASEKELKQKYGIDTKKAYMKSPLRMYGYGKNRIEFWGKRNGDSVVHIPCSMGSTEFANLIADMKKCGENLCDAIRKFGKKPEETAYKYPITTTTI